MKTYLVYFVTDKKLLFMLFLGAKMLLDSGRALNAELVE